MNQPDRNPFESFFETLMWKSRLIVLLAVIFGMLSSFALFVAGCYQTVYAIFGFIPQGSTEPDYNLLLIRVIGSVDLFLIAIVLLIFSFGIYELFISKIDPARHDRDIDILEIKTLDDLKNRLLKVIIMVLIVQFFKAMLSIHSETPLEMLYMGLAILSVAASLFFIRHVEKEG